MGAVTPLRVTFHMAEPVVTGAFPLHLDALVAYVETQRKLRDADVDQTASLRSLADDLPFEKIERDGDWVWGASALVPSGVGEQYVRMWRTHTPIDDYARRFDQRQIDSRTKFPLKPFAQIMDTQRGVMKNMLERYPVQNVDKFEAWCLCTDRQRLDELLGEILSIGARRRVNHGRLKCAPEIVKDESALDLWKLRVLPWQEEGYVPVQAGVRPPYWAPETKRLAYLPETF